jgi:hypothetical protein
MSPKGIEVFAGYSDVEVDVKVGMSEDELLEVIGDYDGLAIRSATKVTARVIAAAKRLKVVGRAGIGVDNVDIPAATAQGIVVMNTPKGNTITTAEHTVSMMLSLSRNINIINPDSGPADNFKFFGRSDNPGRNLGGTANRETVIFTNYRQQLIFRHADLDVNFNITVTGKDFNSFRGHLITDQDLKFTQFSTSEPINQIVKLQKITTNSTLKLHPER